MSDFPATARAVVIGGGIVGNSLVGHLAELGWRDLVQLDKGPFPNPGGSTGHASNFIYPVDHSKEMTQLTLDSMRQYKEAGTLIESGGLEVARTEERLEELRRRMASAKSFGVDGVRLVTPLGPFRVDVGYNPYAFDAGPAFYVQDANVAAGRPGRAICVSPSTTEPLTLGAGATQPVPLCPATFLPLKTRGLLSRLVFHFSIGNAF